MTQKTNTIAQFNRHQVLTLGAGALAASLTTAMGLSTGRSMAAGMANTLTQVRNATLRIDYGGVRFLVDPLLADKGAYPGFEGSANSGLRNPLVSLPMPVKSIVDVDAVIVTHLHSDHWDDAAKAGLRKSMPIFAQNEEDTAQIRGAGFTDGRVLTETTELNGVRLAKTGGQHGTDDALTAMPALGQACGIAFSHPSAKTLYVAGDTIWNRHVAKAITMHKPDVIVLNAGKAVMTGFAPIIMGEADVLAVHKAAPEAVLVASHMEAINHCILSRADLRAFSEREGFASSLLIPADGESLRI
ncbi:MAG: beta-lactamase-like protein [Microvirga sp.]|jgi:L-ascorbate metabolism protein UlaG (beta-lactamase superfamily)|nr:beta-lactamase-like protein [Microvirga sp.]